MQRERGNAPKLLNDFLMKKLSGILKDFLKRFDLSKVSFWEKVELNFAR